MKEVTTTYVGLDVHKDSIVVAIAEGGRDGEVRFYGAIGGDLGALDRLIRKLRSRHAKLAFVYEAGPCGYVIFRHLKKKGLSCTVVAPSKTPKKSGDKIKNDRRDALDLARLHRAGELTGVYVPDAEDEAMRDLTRAREDAKSVERKARQRLNALLLRHDKRYPGRTRWGTAHRRWLSTVKMEHPAQQVAFQEYVDAVEESTRRVERLTEQIRILTESWRMAPVVQAFRTFRGVDLIVAATVVAEVGDLTRFDNPRQLMAFLGLVPSEHSSGPTQRRGSITKAGNGHARRVLVEGAWSYRLSPRVSRPLLARQEGMAQPILDVSWKAQTRLCGRYRKLRARGKSTQVVTVAIARELVGFLWDVAHEVTPVPCER
jgi:transposase